MRGLLGQVQRGGEDLHEGWATGADYPLGEEFDWVCPDCFGDLAPVLGWRGEG